MTTIRDTARRVLAVLDAADACGEQGLSLGNHNLTADDKLLIAHLATACPGLIQTVQTDTDRWHAASVVSPGGSSFGFYHVAPACYEAEHPHRYEAARDAYAVLVSLAAIDDAPSLVVVPAYMVEAGQPRWWHLTRAQAEAHARTITAADLAVAEPANPELIAWAIVERSAPDLARARANHRPHPASPVDGDPYTETHGGEQ